MAEENRPGDDEERRRHRRELDAKNARLRRAKRRADKERAWREAQATGATGSGVVDETPPSVMLKDHIVRTVRSLEAVERDETISNAERARIYVQAVPALCRAVDADEFRSRLEAVERALAQHARPQLRSVGS